jgi:hypothetical protein
MGRRTIAAHPCNRLCRAFGAKRRQRKDFDFEPRPHSPMNTFHPLILFQRNGYKVLAATKRGEDLRPALVEPQGKIVGLGEGDLDVTVDFANRGRVPSCADRPDQPDSRQPGTSVPSRFAPDSIERSEHNCGTSRRSDSPTKSSPSNMPLHKAYAPKT